METQHLTEPAGKSALAAAGRANNQERTQTDCGAPNEIGQRKIDDVDGVRELEQQSIGRLLQRRHLNERQRSVDDTLQRSQNILELDVLHLLWGQTHDHEMLFGNGVYGRLGLLLGGGGLVRGLLCIPPFLRFLQLASNFSLGDAEIPRLEAVQEAQVTQVVIEKAKALGIVGLPAQVLAGLDKISESMPQVSPASKDGYSECDEQADITTVVRLSRNASPANRHARESAGLHWNGRAGGWTGLITATALGRLRTDFGARVEKPELANAGESSAEAQRGDVDSLSSTEAERLMTPSETAMEQGGS